ncbi:MAG: response regulator [Bacteroidales bacterium]|jgi:DNA-binding response OmpR family regulator|nr:response regulator [Bacteroidales bacterium]MCK9498825.1 response regulator [Bacteroidales bacterium]MDY0314863.1 response regulator [Bacteroidales bacterium]NLB86386.1 response regulator [Bacteroidales bacterium]
MTKLNKTILIADDDFDFLFQIRLKLETEGFDVIATNSQKEAENAIRKFEFDAAVFDLMMENDESGFILAYKVKKKNPNIPVVITTAVSAETGIFFNNDNKWIKADIYLEKGLESDCVCKELKKLLNIEK